MGPYTYVGFGFGAIQAGLFLFEAFRSGAFSRMVVAEVVPAVVEAVRAGGGKFFVNIAHEGRVEQAEVGPVELENPSIDADRARLIQTIAEAQEIGTAVPSVKFYATAGPGSLHRVLAEGLRRKVATGGPRAVVYTAENNNHAAEILEEAVMEAIPEAEREAVRARVRFLNTVVGKMSGIISEPAEVEAAGLATITRADPRAFLVEAFNRILISRIDFGDGEPFKRGIKVFEEKTDLLPFEEAKLYGHNATHALAAYLAIRHGVETLAELRERPAAMGFLRAAFLEESGAALIRKYDGLDRLFTPEGFREYAEDLLVRMSNPCLMDRAERVGRDPQRKLGWDDRLIGTMRLALGAGIEPRRYAVGAAVALGVLDPAFLAKSAVHPSAQSLLDPLWPGVPPESEEKRRVLELVEQGRVELEKWESGIHS